MVEIFLPGEEREGFFLIRLQGNPRPAPRPSRARTQAGLFRVRPALRISPISPSSPPSPGHTSLPVSPPSPTPRSRLAPASMSASTHESFEDVKVNPETVAPTNSSHVPRAGGDHPEEFHVPTQAGVNKVKDARRVWCVLFLSGVAMTGDGDDWRRPARARRWLGAGPSSVNELILPRPVFQPSADSLNRLT